MIGSSRRPPGGQVVVLRNDDIALTVQRAGEVYRGSRFDWNGFVSQIHFRNMTLLGHEEALSQRDPMMLGRGLHNEFGITKCVGYDDCAVGGWFPKVGTGWLRKDDGPYSFDRRYPLEEVSFDCDVSGDSQVFFTCESGERNGYAYRYVKTITLTDLCFSIGYQIENLGSKPLDTDEYVHNFLCFGGRRMDVGYSLSFPRKIDVSRLSQNKNPDRALSITENRLDIVGRTDREFYFGAVTAGATESDGGAPNWTFSDSVSGITLSERGSFTPSEVNVWGSGSVISPEVFFEFRLEPGAATTWERVYSLQ